MKFHFLQFSDRSTAVALCQKNAWDPPLDAQVSGEALREQNYLHTPGTTARGTTLWIIIILSHFPILGLISSMWVCASCPQHHFWFHGVVEGHLSFPTPCFDCFSDVGSDLCADFGYRENLVERATSNLRFLRFLKILVNFEISFFAVF